jgi:hypothetical protein
VDWIGLAKDRNRWRALVNSALNLRVPWNAGKLSSGLASSYLASSYSLEKDCFTVHHCYWLEQVTLCHPLSCICLYEPIYSSTNAFKPWRSKQLVSLRHWYPPKWHGHTGSQTRGTQQAQQCRDNMLTHIWEILGSAPAQDWQAQQLCIILLSLSRRMSGLCLELRLGSFLPNPHLLSSHDHLHILFDTVMGGGIDVRILPHINRLFVVEVATQL